MPSFCAVLDCSDKYGHGQNVPFHKFPAKHKDLLEKWIEFTQRPSDWRPSKWMSVCGLHFRDDDYRCLEQKKLLKKNAVPSIRTTDYPSVARNVANKTLNGLEDDEESSNCGTDEPAQKPDLIDSNCRFCGFTKSTFVTFANNFELFGVIQKCLPALSIRQDDNLPKEICRRCLRRLKNFASFIDKVLETQDRLQRQFRIEKGCTKSNERVLKIKQEPVVRVKQENLDDVNVFFPDEVYDGCGCGEQEHESEAQMDQKFQFCDFPALNDQDLINNCDIMEIINLSDPFIDITNCENNIAEEEPQQQQQQQQQFEDNRTRKQQTLPELLQSHFLTEEHNYANLNEDMKEEWPIRHSYKTEKIEADESEPNFSVESEGIEDIIQDTNLNFIEDDNDVAATVTVTTSNDNNQFDRANRPIVTSVSSFNEANMLPTITHTSNFSNTEGQQLTSRKKPNIVVLNESIVQSSHALQFQACTICQSKFFSVDSLNHHYGIAHSLQVTSSNSTTTTTTLPMVIVPSSNIIWDRNQQLQNNNYKTEKDVGFGSQQMESSAITDQTQTQTQTPTPTLSKRSSKNEIKILDMQQTFLQQYHYTNQLHVEQQQQQELYCETQQPSTTTAQQFETPFALHIEGQQTASNNCTKKKFSSSSECNSVGSQQFLTPYFTNSTSTTNPKADVAYETYDVETRTSSNGNLEKITSEYLELQKRYRRLRRKCLNLAQRRTRQKQNCFRCRICSATFDTVFQLLRHKQSTPSHHVRKPPSNFAASCAGCEKFFCRKIALVNHMRFICQALPLRWLKNQLRTFKCRYCRRITFTHWRLCRKHEIKCQHRKKSKKKLQNSKSSNHLRHNTKPKISKISRNSTYRKKSLTFVRNSHPQNAIKKLGSYECEQCRKIYPSLSSLNQHRITHTNLRAHQCNICQRIFKRRNGLTQHVRGFHMKLKPYECPTCKHCYALKGDMRRCKHSALIRRVCGVGAGSEKKNAQLTKVA